MSPALSWGIMTLVGAAILIAFWVWSKGVQWRYLEDLARNVKSYGAGTDPWEEPTIVATYGGIHDVEEDQWT